MQKIIYFILLLFTLVSCKDDISINTINNNEKMVVYCFPTESDTTYMQVERSVPVKKYFCVVIAVLIFVNSIYISL